MSLLLGNGDGTFQIPFVAAAGTTSVAIVAWDFNKNGLPDVALVNAASDNVSTWAAHPAVRHLVCDSSRGRDLYEVHLPSSPSVGSGPGEGASGRQPIG